MAGNRKSMNCTPVLRLLYEMRKVLCLEKMQEMKWSHVIVEGY